MTKGEILTELHAAYACWLRLYTDDAYESAWAAEDMHIILKDLILKLEEEDN